MISNVEEQDQLCQNCEKRFHVKLKMSLWGTSLDKDFEIGI